MRMQTQLRAPAWLGRFARFARFALLSLIVSFIAFVLQLALPGDAATLASAVTGDPRDAQATRIALGLDRPWLERYLRWLGAAFRGDFGRSFANGDSVLMLLGRALRVTAELAFATQVVIIVVALSLGILSAQRIGGRLDALIRTLSFGAAATPAFVVATALILTFAVRLHWLPTFGFVPFLDSPVDNIRSLVMPALTAGIPLGALAARILRADLAAALAGDHATLCRAMGFSQRRIVLRHALRGSTQNLLSILGFDFARLLGGTILVEQIFAIGGLGRLVLESVIRRDQPVVQAVVLVAGVSFLAISSATDGLSRLLDPRLRTAAIPFAKRTETGDVR